MLMRTLSKLPALAFTTALVIPAASFAAAEWQYTDWDNDGNLELTEEEFTAGFGETGHYDALDRDEQAGLSQGEFASGVFADWDRDNDLQITEAEYDAGAERWYGADYDVSYGDWDADESGYIDTTEFGGGWDEEYFNAWDMDSDSYLSEDEYNTGLYNTVDADESKVITVQEEGWFEGWFDGDNVEAEIEEVGDVL